MQGMLIRLQEEDVVEVHFVVEIVVEGEAGMLTKGSPSTSKKVMEVAFNVTITRSLGTSKQSANKRRNK